MKETKCDAVMVSRAAIGDPYVFERILYYLKSGKEKEFDIKKNLKAFYTYLGLEKKYYGNKVDIGRVKYIGSKFLRGFQGAAEKRAEFMGLKDVGEMKRFVKAILE